MISGVQAHEPIPHQRAEPQHGPEAREVRGHGRFHPNHGRTEHREARVEAFLAHKAEKIEAGKLDPEDLQHTLRHRFGDSVDPAFSEDGSVDFNKLEDVFLGRSAESETEVVSEVETAATPTVSEVDQSGESHVAEAGESAEADTGDHFRSITLTISLIHATLKLEGFHPEQITSEPSH